MIRRNGSTTRYHLGFGFPAGSTHLSSLKFSISLSLPPAPARHRTLLQNFRHQTRPSGQKMTWRALKGTCTPCGYPRTWTTRLRRDSLDWQLDSSSSMVGSGDGKSKVGTNFSSLSSGVSLLSGMLTTTSDTRGSTPHAAPSSTVSGGLHLSKTSNGTSPPATNASFAKLPKSASHLRSPSLLPSSKRYTSTPCSCPLLLDSTISFKPIVLSLLGQSGTRSAPRLAGPSEPSFSKRSCVGGVQSRKSSLIMGPPTSPPWTG